MNVQPAVLTVTASGGSFITGETPPAITAAITGYVNGESESVVTTAPVCSTTADSSSPVGTYPSNCSGAAAANYSFHYVAGSVTVNPVPAWGISLAKSANVSSFNVAGQHIVYTYTVVNTGNQNVGPGQFRVSDDKINGGTAFDCGASVTLTPNTSSTNEPTSGSFVTCQATYTVTQQDVDHGSVTNSATASVFANDRNLTAGSVSVTVEASQKAELTLAKAANKSTFTSVGETITYTYTLTNTGNVTLDGQFSVTDNKIASVDCSAAGDHLAPGAHTTCTATYAITQADKDAGTVINTATAFGHYIESAVTSNGTAAEVKLQAPGPTATPTPTPTPTPSDPAATPTPIGSPTATPTEQVGGVTAPPATPTLPSTSSSSHQGSDGGSTPLIALLICLAFGGLGLLVVQAQRRSIRG